MAIVDYSYYENTYMGEPVATADFPRYAAMAERVVSAVCRGQYETLISKLSTSAAAKITEAYMNAICAQIEYYSATGILSATTGQSDDGFTVGKVSVTGGSNGSSFANRGAAMVSPSVALYLEQTGLLNRSVNAPFDPFAPFPVGVV